MPKLELTIATDYVRNWDVLTGIRELIQNTVDANDIGYEMEIKYNPDRKEPTLILVNRGITLSRDALLLGTTTKADDDRQRGCFGEGMKLGWLTLLRAGLKIWIKSGDEKWVPTLAYSDTYQSELLTVETSKAKYENCIKVEVRGLGPDIWDQYRSQILFSPGIELKRNEYIAASKDRILTREDLRGKLFVRGLYVSQLPGSYWFGYDFYDLKLDRDRKIADPWDLKSAIRGCLNNAAERKLLPIDDMYLMLDSNRWEEHHIVAETWSIYQLSELANQIATRFHNEYGKDCIPVEDTFQSMEAAQHGLRTKVVSKAIKALIESIDGKYEDKKNNRALEVNKAYDFYELTEEEQQNIFWARDCLERIDEQLKINIVDFYGENVLGAYKSGDISISKKVVVDRSQFIATIVHELAHRGGLQDGSVEHRNEEERLFSNLIYKLTLTN